ncbi:MAG: hypothetical protein A3F18_07450 [Legionellales bacterium RIFCSPHIGHO2_12_FULL_37_14]|nr:MAG: hypothetical protein A3F18_07450 [Legionellales bacterium RIFCSPHIGHO2_12_FULL_37_14]
MALRMVRPDAKGRVTLGSLTKGISGFSVRQEPNGTVILKPFVEMPINEKWLFKNMVALERVRKGLEQAKNKKLIDRGSFAQFSDDEIE